MSAKLKDIFEGFFFKYRLGFWNFAGKGISICFKIKVNLKWKIFSQKLINSAFLLNA